MPCLDSCIQYLGKRSPGPANIFAGSCSGSLNWPDLQHIHLIPFFTKAFHSSRQQNKHATQSSLHHWTWTSKASDSFMPRMGATVKPHRQTADLILCSKFSFSNVHEYAALICDRSVWYWSFCFAQYNSRRIEVRLHLWKVSLPCC